MTRLIAAMMALLSLPALAADVERVTRGNLAIEGIPEIPPELQQRMRRYQFSRGAFFADWTPDGRITVSTRFGNTNQLHIVDRPMGARRQITFFDEPINGGEWSPTGARKGIAFIRDVGGDENFQLEYLEPAMGTAGAAHRRARPRGLGRVVAGRHAVRLPLDGPHRRADGHLRRRPDRPDAAADGV